MDLSKLFFVFLTLYQTKQSWVWQIFQSISKYLMPWVFLPLLMFLLFFLVQSIANILIFRQWQPTLPTLYSSWLWVGLLVSSMHSRPRFLSFAIFFCSCCCFAHFIEFWIKMHFPKWIFHPACKDDVLPRLLPPSNKFFSRISIWENVLAHNFVFQMIVYVVKHSFLAFVDPYFSALVLLEPFSLAF